MTTNYEMFVNLLVQAFPDYVTDADTSTVFWQMDQQVRYNINQVVDAQEVILASGSTYTITIPNLSTGWYLFAVTCTGSPPITTPPTCETVGVAGQGYITTTGTNAASTAITGYVPMYGVAMPSGVNFPGIVFLSTQGMTANPTITSQANGSIFQVFIATLVEDGS